MSGFDMFCERCGKRYGSEETTAAGSLPLGRRLLMAVGVGSSAPRPPHHEPVLRFCLACRGYSCASCWNEDAGFCQTCVPLPEPVTAEPVFETNPQFAFDAAPVAAAEPMPLALAVETISAELDMAPEPVIAEPEVEPAFAEPEPVAVEMVTVEPKPVAVEPDPIPMFAELEPPVDVVYAEEASFTEPEPDVHWDWSLEFAPEAESEAESQPVPAAKPEAVFVVEAAAPEASEVPQMPAVPEPPTVPMAPIFRPLTPMGPLMPPPPPPVASPVPRIEFELPDAPPAFVIARPPLTPALRPTLPVGLFDGPGPTVRPCPHCDLPVSAKARFCRRCGSAQS